MNFLCLYIYFSVSASIFILYLLEYLMARNILVGSSEKPNLWLIRKILFFISEIPFNGSIISPKSKLFNDDAIELIEKSLLNKSS